MKILMINDYVRFGGAENVATNLASWLVSDGHEVILSVRNSKSASTISSFEVRTEGSSIPTPVLDHQIYQVLRYDFVAYHHYLELIKKIKPDVIHCHNISSFGTAPVLAARAYSIPCVFTAHDYWLIGANKNLMTRQGYMCLNGPSWNCIQKSINLFSSMGKINQLFAPFVKRTIHNRIRDFSDVKIVTVSEFQKSVFSPFFAEERIEIIRNGIDIRELDAVPNSSEKKRVIFMGGYSKLKGIEHFLKVASMINDKKTVANFSVTGASNTGKNAGFPSVVFEGKLPRSRLLSLLKSSNCLIFPSIWAEPSPLAILEAMGLGVPVIAYNIGSIPEIIVDNVNGFLVDLGDYQTLAEKVALLIGDKRKRQELSINAIEKIHSQYGLSRMAKQYENLYTKLS